MATWLNELLCAQHGASDGLITGAIDPQGVTMRSFAALVLQQPALGQAEFQCVASDFSRICRGKLAPDSLNRHSHLMRSGQ